MPLNYTPLPIQQPTSYPGQIPKIAQFLKKSGTLFKGVQQQGIQTTLPQTNQINQNGVVTPPQKNYTPAPNYSPAPAVDNTSSTDPTKTSSLNSPAAKEYMGTLTANQVNTGTTQQPIIQTNTPAVNAGTEQKSTPGLFNATTGLTNNGLTANQVGEGFSTIPGQYNPTTGQLNNPSGQQSITTQQNPNVQKIDPITGLPLTPNSNNQTDQAYNTYLQSLQPQQAVIGSEQALNDFTNKANQLQNSIGSQPILSSFATGQQEVAAQNANAQEQYLQGNVGIAQNAQAQLQQAAQAGLNYSQGQQQLAQTLKIDQQPTVASYGQTVFNPATGTFSGGGALDPQTQAATLAQQVASGKISYTDAVAGLGYAGSAGTAFLQNALSKIPGVNLNQLEGQSAATQQNAATIGGISTAANAQGYTNALQTYNSLNTAANSARDQATSVSQILLQSGLNNLDSTDANSAINNLSGRLGSTNVTALETAVAELQNRYSALLASNGTTPSGAQTQALALLNPNSSAKQINQAINILQNSAGILVANQYQQLQGYQQQLNSGGTSTASSGGLYSF